MQLSLFSSDTSRAGDPTGELSPAVPVDVPTVLFVRHRHARRYILRVLPDGSVRVTLPRWGSKREALAFVETQHEWIRRERARRRSEVRPRDSSGPLRLMIDAWYRRRAERELPSMLHALASAHDIRVTRVSVRDQRSRWGACSSRGSITLNWRLILVPEFVREYVLLHELMHRRELNHSRRFWRLVAACCPRHLEARRWLTTEGKSLWPEHG